MRRNDRLINLEETIDILNKGEYGVLSLIDESNLPYSVPVNYVYKDNYIYIHSAKASAKKINSIINNNNVFFNVVIDVLVDSKRFTTKYKSANVLGSAYLLENEDAYEGLELILKKYSNSFYNEGIKYINADISKIYIIKIEVKELIGKANK